MKHTLLVIIALTLPIICRGNCDGLSLEEASKLSRDFMIATKMSRPGEEGDPGPDLVVRWRAMKLKKYEGGCLVAMNCSLGMKDGNTTHWEVGELYDAVALVQVDGKWKAKAFEKLVKPVKSMEVAIGGQDKHEHTFYYAKLSGASAIAIQKSRELGMPACGLTASIPAKKVIKPNGKFEYVGTGKASFDPTLGRTWKLITPEFDLHRGMTAEIYDANPGLFDDYFHDTIAGMGGKGFDLKPWSSCTLRHIREDGRWRKVKMDASLGHKQGENYGGGIGVASEELPTSGRKRIEWRQDGIKRSWGPGPVMKDVTGRYSRDKQGKHPAIHE